MRWKHALAGLALAGEVVSADQISKALQSKPLTRGLSAGQQQIDTATQAKESKFVNSLRNRSTRSLSLGEATQDLQFWGAGTAVIVAAGLLFGAILTVAG